MTECCSIENILFFQWQQAIKVHDYSNACQDKEQYLEKRQSFYKLDKRAINQKIFSSVE